MDEDLDLINAGTAGRLTRLVHLDGASGYRFLWRPDRQFLGGWDWEAWQKKWRAT